MPRVVNGPFVDAPEPYVFPDEEDVGGVREGANLVQDLLRVIRTYLRSSREVRALLSESSSAMSETIRNDVGTYTLHYFSPTISSVEVITEESLQGQDIDAFLSYAPPLRAEGRVRFGIREADLPEPEWEY